jgi:hypothetical protein
VAGEAIRNAAEQLPHLSLADIEVGTALNDHLKKYPKKRPTMAAVAATRECR